MNRSYEELAMNAWPSLTTNYYDGWLLKYANGYTKRANSVYPIYGGTLDMEEKIKYCEHYYKELGLQATFKMNDSDVLRMLDRCLEDNGYHVLDPTDVMTLSLDDYEIIGDTYRVHHGYDEEWTSIYTRLIGITGEDQQSIVAVETINKMLESITQPSFFVTFMDKTEPVAIGYGVVERETLGVFNIIVKEDYRGQGYGDRVMKALLTEGIRLGAKESYLQVVCENQVAVNLYKKMGYKKLYTYWYRRKK